MQILFGLEIGEIVIVNKFDKIIYFEAALKNPKEFLNELKQLPWIEWQRGDGSPIGEQTTTIINNHECHNEIADVINICFNEYSKELSLDVSLYKVLKERLDWKKWYFPMQGMSAHPDLVTWEPGVALTPDFTILIYLNDDYFGGKINFPDKNISIKPTEGSVIIFPGEELHEVTDLVEGHRYMTSTFAFLKDRFDNRYNNV